MDEKQDRKQTPYDRQLYCLHCGNDRKSRNGEKNRKSDC